MIGHQRIGQYIDERLICFLINKYIAQGPSLRFVVAEKIFETN